MLSFSINMLMSQPADWWQKIAASTMKAPETLMLNSTARRIRWPLPLA